MYGTWRIKQEVIMKKVFICLWLTINLVVIGMLAYADYVEKIQASRTSYSISIDNVEDISYIPQFSVDDKVYVPLRLMCTALYSDVHWDNATKTIRIIPLEEQSSYKFDENAVSEIADAVISDCMGEEFIKCTEAKIYEENSHVLKMGRTDGEVNGKSCVVTISKRDGSIIDISCSK